MNAATPDAPPANDTRAFLLRSGASQAGNNLQCLAALTALILDAIAGDEGIGAATPDALRWLGRRLNDSAEALAAIQMQRPARWHVGLDQSSDAGRALAMLDAEPAPVLDTPGLRAAISALDAAKGNAE